MSAAYPDLNLLLTLDVLLAEGSVARASRRLGLSASAMSRALARLRESTGDPLLVRAGRGLVPTPRALELRERVGPLLREAQGVLRPVEQLDLQSLQRTFTLRASEGYAETFGPALIERLASEAPGVRLRFVQKPDRESASLREGIVDLEAGVTGKETAPELRVQSLYRDRFIGVVRAGHPLSRGKVTPARYAAGRHIGISRRLPEQNQARGQIDTALDNFRLQRDVATIVGGFATAIALARATDLIASVPERHTAGLRSGMFSFALPMRLPGLTISLHWHPRLEADPAHRWLRACVREVTRAVAGEKNG